MLCYYITNRLPSSSSAIVTIKAAIFSSGLQLLSNLHLVDKMVQISFLGATAVLVGVAAARPQGPGGGGPVIPCNQVMKYRYVKWGPAKKTDPQIVSGETCVNQGNAPTDPRCSSTHTVSHSVYVNPPATLRLSDTLQSVPYRV